MEDAVELVRAPDAAGALAAIESSTEPGRVPRADFAVVSGPEQVDATIRPRSEAQTALVRPRGEVLLHPDGVIDDSPLLAAVRGRGLRLSSSRCGAFGPALELMAGDERLRHLGDELVTHRFPSSSMAQAFEVARSPECVKAVIEHGDAG